MNGKPKQEIDFLFFLTFAIHCDNGTYDGRSYGSFSHKARKNAEAFLLRGGIGLSSYLPGINSEGSERNTRELLRSDWIATTLVSFDLTYECEGWSNSLLRISP